ncbi:hypothetical protein ABZX73_06345 [Brevibacterium casei]
MTEVQKLAAQAVQEAIDSIPYSTIVEIAEEDFDELFTDEELLAAHKLAQGTRIESDKPLTVPERALEVALEETRREEPKTLPVGHYVRFLARLWIQVEPDMSNVGLLADSIMRIIGRHGRPVSIGSRADARIIAEYLDADGVKAAEADDDD